MSALRLTEPDKFTGDELEATYVNDIKGAVNQHADLLDNLNANPPASYTDAQARAAQLNRVASGTTVTLTSEAPTDYGTIANGSFTVDATGCVVGKVVRFSVGSGASAPAFINAPAGQPYKTVGAAYASGQAFDYSLLVCVDKIQVVIV